MIAAERTEWAVEYTMNGELFVYEAESEHAARQISAALDGTILVRKILETSWAQPEAKAA